MTSARPVALLRLEAIQRAEDLEDEIDRGVSSERWREVAAVLDRWSGFFQIAAEYGVSDAPGSPVAWRCEQEKGEPRQYAVRVRIERTSPTQANEPIAPDESPKPAQEPPRGGEKE